jgi:RNA polymerase-binding transcription factor DksA
MNRVETNAFYQRLLELKQRLRGDLTALECEALTSRGGKASGGLSDLPMHPADLGTDQYEEEINLGLLENQARIIEEIGDALRRIEAGRFGRCEECGQAIPRKRLDALPYARYCMRDAQRLQGRAGD